MNEIDVSYFVSHKLPQGIKLTENHAVKDTDNSIKYDSIDLGCTVLQSV